jgi:hypothetical protein
MRASSSACCTGGRSRWGARCALADLLAILAEHDDDDVGGLRRAHRAGRVAGGEVAVGGEARREGDGNVGAEKAGELVGQFRRADPRQAGIVGILPVLLVGGGAADDGDGAHRGAQRQGLLVVAEHDDGFARDRQRGLA